MKKIKTLVLFFGAMVAMLAAHAESLNNVSSGAVVPGEWNSNFEACKTMAESKGIPMLVFWSSPGCAKCNKMKKALNGGAFVQWRQERRIILMFAEGDVKVKAFAKNSSGDYPYMRIYWPAGGVDEKFTGRAGRIGGAGSTVDEQLISKLNSLLQGWKGDGSSTPIVVPHTPVVGSEWNRARKLSATIWDGSTIVGSVELAAGRANRSGGARIKVHVLGTDGKKKAMGNKDVQIDRTTSGTVSGSNGTISFSITGSSVTGKFSKDGASYEVKAKAAGGDLQDGTYYFQLDSNNYPTECKGLKVIDFLPFNQKFTVQNNKLKFDRKGTIRSNSGTFTMSSMDNPSGLKLTYNKTKGYVKGSFNVYCQDGARAKKISAKVGGFMVGKDSIGAGKATVDSRAYPFTITK